MPFVVTKVACAKYMTTRKVRPHSQSTMKNAHLLLGTRCDAFFNDSYRT